MKFNIPYFDLYTIFANPYSYTLVFLNSSALELIIGMTIGTSLVMYGVEGVYYRHGKS